jgi:hypothetical protein
MACTIDTTISGASANSYCSIADADSYHETHPYATTWENADSDQKCRALQTATRLLDQWYEWQGIVADSAQRLLWPRIGVTGPHGYLEPSDAIPERIEQATAELARQLLDADRTVDSDLEAQGITALKAGSVELSFSGMAKTHVIPNAVAAFVGVYGREASRSGGAVTIQRG